MSLLHLGRDEQDAFEKLKMSLDYCAEACVELGTRRSDGRWAMMAENFRLMHQAVIELAMDGQSRGRKN